MGPLSVAIAVWGLVTGVALVNSGLPANVERALRYAPACALTAIVVQGVLARDHQAYVSVHNYQMWALVAAGLVFAKTRNMMAMMAVGMAVFTVLRLSF